MSPRQDHPWSYETDENVVICDQRGWNDATKAELQALMEQFEEHASRDEITASLTIMDPDTKLDQETQQFLKQNSPVYERLGIKKVALVSEGLKAMATSSLVDTPPSVEIETFDERHEAVEWCKA